MAGWHGGHALRVSARRLSGFVAAAAVALTREHGFEELAAAITLYQGWMLVERGQTDEGIVQMGQSVAALQTRGAAVGRPFYLGLLAEAYGKAEQPDKGLVVLAEALALVEQTDERFYEAELYRLKGELTLQLSCV